MRSHSEAKCTRPPIGAPPRETSQGRRRYGEDQHAEPESGNVARRQHDSGSTGFEHRAALQARQRAEEAANAMRRTVGHGEQHRVRRTETDEVPRHRLAVAELHPEFALGGVS